MSFMSVPALDRLLEPTSEIESTSVQPWSARADRHRYAVNMPQPSPPQARISPPPFSPSPFVLNFKRRVYEGANDRSAIETASYGLDGQLREASTSKSKGVLDEDGVLPVREVPDRLRLGGNSVERNERFRVEKIENLMSNPVVEAKDMGGESRSRNGSSGQQDFDFSSNSSNREEFFDAPEEPFDDSTSDEESLRGQRTPRSRHGGRRDVDGSLKLLLEQEIKRRIAAEDAMAVLQLQCTEMASHLASSDEESRDLIGPGRTDSDVNFEAERLVVAQVVASSVARGAARAELDEEMESVVGEKNREIARLRDKLHYYELVNHEMSQRNQEAFELARSRRQVRRNRNQWLMVCAGSAICVGVSAILVRKFAPWASSQFPAKSILPSRMRTDTYHSASSHGV